MVYALRWHTVGRRIVAVGALASGLLGCSMHPLPENFLFSRASTFDIVQRIRCEAKAGLDKYQSDGDAQRIIAATTIGFDFDFNMTEKNNANSGGLTFKNKVVKGFQLDLTASAERKRQNIRRFLVIEELAKLTDADCSNAATRANWVYPIAGAIGMDEVVATYIKLEKLSDLTAEGSKAPGQAAFFGSTKAALFADVLTFRTTLTAGATPRLVLSAVNGSFRLTNASIAVTAERRDVHTVIVALARAPGDIDPVVTTARERQRGITRKHNVADRRAQTVQLDVDPRVNKAREKRDDIIHDRDLVDRRTETALAQKNADATNKVVMELARLRSLREDARETPRLLGEKLLEFMRPPEFIRPRPPEDEDPDG